MSWTDVEERIAPRSIYNASVRLHQRKHSKPSLIIALRKSIVAETKWKGKDAFGLSVGIGEFAGKVRIIRGAKKAIAIARDLKSALTLDFGHVPQLGERGAAKAEAIATVIDANTIELKLPDFEYDDQEEAAAPAKAAPPSSAAKPDAEKVIIRNGITVDVGTDHEEIVYRGKAMELTARQAIFAAEVLKAMPNPVVRGLLETKIWGLRPPPGAAMALDQVVMDLGKGLKSVGLELKNNNGMSFALRALA